VISLVKQRFSDVNSHDLRHQRATVALNASFSGQVVKDLSGWNSEAMSRRYAALTDETLKLTAEAVAAHGTGQRLRLVKSGAAKRRATN
jgi:integrase